MDSVSAQARLMSWGLGLQGMRAEIGDSCPLPCWSQGRQGRATDHPANLLLRQATVTASSVWSGENASYNKYKAERDYGRHFPGN